MATCSLLRRTHLPLATFAGWMGARSTRCDEPTAADEEGQVLERQIFRPPVPYPAWDYNWDGRMTPRTSPERLQTRAGFAEGRKNGVTRHIFLVRHGQYDETCKEDQARVLTALGRRQAHLTGQRLAHYLRGGYDGHPDEFQGPCSILSIQPSDMERAKETARIIASHLPTVPIKEPDPMLNEALPAPMIPCRPDVGNAAEEIDQNHERIEAAFHKYIHRGGPSEEEEQEFTVLVAHGNVIRYFLCRALQLPPEAWLRFSTFNCSITYLVIYPDGYCAARLVGDIGHLGYDETTFSGNHGFKF